MSAIAFSLVRLALFLLDAAWNSRRDADLRRRWRARDTRPRWLGVTRAER
jgi:hypothetical protein